MGRLVRLACPAGGQDRLPSPTSFDLGSWTVSWLTLYAAAVFDPTPDPGRPDRPAAPDRPRSTMYNLGS